jgi:hypothetical protein
MREPIRFPSVIFLFVPAVVAFFSVLTPTECALGDGNSATSRPRYQRPTTRQYNDRLPPVMPGEEIVTETGQKMKTWSSAGPVPVNRRPPPQALSNGTGGVGVIVDGRERYGHEQYGGEVGGGGQQPLAPRRR